MFLRLKAKQVNCFIKRAERSQSKNASVFSEGGDAEADSRVERVEEISVSYSTARASRAGKDGGWNCLGLVADLAFLGYMR